MKYLLIQFLMIFIQSAFGTYNERLLNDIGPLSKTYRLLKCSEINIRNDFI